MIGKAILGGYYDFDILLTRLQELGVRCEKIPESELIKISYNAQTHYLVDHCFPHILLGDQRAIEDKFHLKRILSSHNIPVINAEIVHSEFSIEEILSHLKNKITCPVVIKPPNEGCGDRVFCAINTEKEFTQLWKQHIANLPSSYYLIEEYWLYCPDYRFFYFKGETPVVSKRTVPTVSGDGLQTIQELVAAENNRRTKFPRNCLCDIVLYDEDGLRCLHDQELTLNSIPAKDAIIKLRYNTNLSYGGMAEMIDFSEFHPSYLDLLNHIWALFPTLPFLSIDILSFDISKSVYDPGNMAVSEAHTTPGIGMFLAPEKGTPVDVLTPMIATLFPDLRIT